MDSTHPWLVRQNTFPSQRRTDLGASGIRESGRANSIEELSLTASAAFVCVRVCVSVCVCVCTCECVCVCVCVNASVCAGGHQHTGGR